MSQNWSKKLSLFFTAQRLQQQLRAKNSTLSPTNLPPEQNVPFYRLYFLSVTWLVCSPIFFLNKIVKIRNKFGPQSSLPSLDKRFTRNPLTCFKPVSGNILRKFVQNSSPKTCELDPIPTSLLMECLDIVLPILTRFANLWHFPTESEICTCKTLAQKAYPLKQRSKKKCRPVLNLSFLSKIIEREREKKSYFSNVRSSLFQQPIKSFPICF